MVKTVGSTVLQRTHSTVNATATLSETEVLVKRFFRSVGNTNQPRRWMRHGSFKGSVGRIEPPQS